MYANRYRARALILALSPKRSALSHNCSTISRDGHDLVEQHEYSRAGRALYGVLTESAMTSEAGRDVSIAREEMSALVEKRDRMRTSLIHRAFQRGCREGGPEQPWPESKLQQLV